MMSRKSERVLMFRSVVFCGLVVAASSVYGQTAKPVSPAADGSIRVATFNSSLNRNEAGQLKRDLADKDNTQAQAIAEIIQRIRPQILLLNEFDYDADGESVRLFCDNYLKVSHNGQPAIDYPFSYTAGVNTGVLSGLDYNRNGSTTDPTDAFGFGRFPGQYGMLVLSQFPIQTDKVRTFQKLLWKRMPSARLPQSPSTNESYYSEPVRNAFRLSSKSHWDVPITIGQHRLHFLVCHPTPPAFDGPERRNQLRNHDEIRLFADYLSPDKAGYIKDDAGKVGGLADDQPFVIAGDLNADPIDGSSENHAIRQLLNHPRVNSKTTPRSEGAAEAAKAQGLANDKHHGDAATDTSDFNDRSTGNLRVDYVLPSKGLKVLKSGVFWPKVSDPSSSLIKATDHRLVWVDLAWP